MIPISPVIQGYEDREVKLGAKQKEYIPLPAIAARDEAGTVVSKWKLSDEELQVLNESREIYLQQLTFGQLFQPIKPSVYPPEIPDPTPAKGLFKRHCQVDYVVRPLSFVTGNRVFIEDAPAFRFDLSPLAEVMVRRTQEKNGITDPRELGLGPKELSRMLYNLAEDFAKMISVSFGADVYYTFVEDPENSWYLREGTLTSGIHLQRTDRPKIRPAMDAGKPAVIACALLQGETDTDQETARSMIRALKSEYPGPYRAIGFSSYLDPTRIWETERDAAAEVCFELEDAFDACMTASIQQLRFEDPANFCAFIANEDSTFLIDSRIWESANRDEKV